MCILKCVHYGVAIVYIEFCFLMLDSSSLHQSEACAAMTTTVPVGIWSFINCKTKQKFICETLRDGYTTTIISPPTTPPLMCPDNWITIDNNCFKVFLFFKCYVFVILFGFLSYKNQSPYKVYLFQPLFLFFFFFTFWVFENSTWTNARAYCRGIGADLASIHSEAELNDLQSKIR